MLFFLAASTNCVFSSVSGRWFNVPQSISLTYPIDNSEINIRAGGQLFPAGKKSVCTSVSDLTNEEDFNAKEKIRLENSENAVIETKHKIKRHSRKSKQHQHQQQHELQEAEYDTYVSHENLHKQSNDKQVANEELLNAIDRTLIQFGLNDNSACDSNMNESVKNINEATTDVLIPTIENIINKTCEFNLNNNECKKRRPNKLEEENRCEKKVISSATEQGNNQNVCDKNKRNEISTPSDYAPSILEYFAVTKSTNTGSFPLRKSKSAPNPFKNVRLRVNFGKF